MTNRPQTIQIFLPTGSPTSIREAEITSRLVKAILFPRNKIQEVGQRDMVHYTGVYFLFGASEDGTKPIVYIGEGEDCYKRIQSHNREKDFWTHCVIIVSKTNDYNKADSKFLEHHCIKKAQEIGRYKLNNGTGSNKLFISESREHDLLDNFETTKILLATLGFPLYENLKSSKETNQQVFYIKRVGVIAKAEYSDEGMLILKGSQARIRETNSFSRNLSLLRQKLIQDKVIKKQNSEYYNFEQDYLAGSPSRASDLIIGNSTNGWIEWKDQNGKTLDELKRK